MKNNEIVLKSIDYRPCYVKGEKALFHQCLKEAFSILPSMSVLEYIGYIIKIKYVMAMLGVINYDSITGY